ncbi:RagB/SusD family nutrient uptake outer membrane protein [Sphingobacterium humi]|uniref:RagB/SusD family nutrient uptake outer membrane protein n=1 Tax=Sphingobacterium humi TaxID=1796905 RepID=A0A6N8KXU4_9SPHI|nr:RagB/SusD family nutrient uptake outer membrane protein [Sphingobacterium humi]MVZ62293.1 RagB/SusD family nutrient uptake outer membrane protein [Sphingobacterium humi]
MKKIFLFLIGGTLFFSCSKKLDVPPPNNITDEQIQELLRSGDAATINTILGGMANNMPRLINGSGNAGFGASDIRYFDVQGLDVMRNLEANDIVFSDQALTIFGGDEYRFLDFTSESTNKNAPYWNYCWNAINTANKLLKYLDDETVGTNTKLMEFKARGLILRGYAFHYLMENYQDAYLQGGKAKLGMPLYDTHLPIQESKARSTSDETYAFIKTDLEKAVQLLKDAGINSTTTKNDFDVDVANFILTRVYVWTGDWAKAIASSSEVLKNYPTLMGQSVYGATNDGTQASPEMRPEKNGFLNNDVNPEVIMGFPLGDALVTHNAWMNPFVENQGGNARGYQRIDERLYSKISDNDFRKKNWMADDWGDYTYPTNNDKKFIPAYTNLKFAATHGLGSNEKKNVGRVTAYYFRSAEALLMKAEAQAQSNDAAGAKATLNILLAARTKAGAPTLTCDNYPSMAGLTPLQMVQLQTRIELWGEGGREYYNNKRWNIPVNRSGSANHVDKSQYPVSKMTLKIPLDEMMYNDKMVQN